jgi:glutaredoxin
MKITIYSSSTCTTCAVLGKWLENNGFSYEKKMIDSDSSIMEEFISISNGYIGVPFTVIDKPAGQFKVLGYDRKALMDALEIL